MEKTTYSGHMQCQCMQIEYITMYSVYEASLQFCDLKGDVTLACSRAFFWGHKWKTQFGFYFDLIL